MPNCRPNWPRSHSYAYPLLTRQAAIKIASYGPIVDLGAGTGYLAAQIERMTGALITPVDICPVGQHGLRAEEAENGWHHGRSFTRVMQGDERILRRYPGYTLCLMFPPKETELPLAYKALRLYEGEHLVYVGEPEFVGPGKLVEFQMSGPEYSTEETRGRTGIAEFHQLLKAEWSLVDQMPLPNWPDLHSALFIYRRQSGKS